MSNHELQLDTIGNEDKQPFYIAQFANGKLSKQGSKQLSFRLYEEFKYSHIKKEANKKVLVAESPTTIYTGRNDSELLETARKYCKYMVGVYDPEEDKMKLYDTEIFCMQAKLPDKHKPEEVKNELNKAAKTDDLTAAFGSQKRKKAMTVRKKNALQDGVLDHAINTAIQQTLVDFDDSVDPRQKPQPDVDSFLPPYNEDAKQAKDVFSIHGIIPELEMEALKSPAQVFFEATTDVIKGWEQEKRFSSEIIKLLKILPAKDDERIHTCSCLLMMQYMISMYNLKPKELRNKNRFQSFEDMPLVVNAGLLERFMVKLESRAGYEMTPRLKDKLRCHILVLALMLEQYSLNYEQLRCDLNMSAVKIMQLLRLVGCKVKAPKRKLEDNMPVEATATLTVPLVFPKLKSNLTKSKKNKH